MYSQFCTPANDNFLNHMLRQEVYRKAHGLDSLVNQIQDWLKGSKEHFIGVNLYFQKDGKKSVLVCKVFVNDGKMHQRTPVSCIVGDMTAMCNYVNYSFSKMPRIERVYFVPASFTTMFPGLTIYADRAL